MAAPRAIAADAHRAVLVRARHLPSCLVDGLGCPVVLARHPAWQRSRHRVLFLGQETARWPIPGARTLRECLALSDPVAALADAYAAFDYGVAAPRVHFIRALRRVERELEDGVRGAVAWSNVGRIDCAPMGRTSASVIGLPRAMRNTVLAWQRGLLAAEIAALRPRAAFFLCGPKYDEALAAEFAGLHLRPVGDVPLRGLARLVHPVLPLASFRTHHPRTLEINKLPYLASLIELARAEAGAADGPR